MGALALVALALAGAMAQLYLVPAAPPSHGAGPQVSVATVNMFGRSATLARIGNPQHHFRVAYASSTGSCTRATVTDQALAHGCLLAMNGGPFVEHPPPGVSVCLGPLVVDGSVVRAVAGSAFGITRTGEWAMGTVSVANVTRGAFTQLISAFSMLVINGTMQPSSSPQIAPRTAVGVDGSGALLMFEADGAELLKEGLTLAQLAQWMRALGAVWAINLDGGGSSTVAYPNGTLFSHPTCHDIPIKCQRPVSTITCIVSRPLVA